MHPNREERMSEKDCGCGPSRRTLLKTGLATAAGLTLPAATAAAQNAAPANTGPAAGAVGIAEGPLPGRNTPNTLEGSSSKQRPAQRQGIDIHAHYYPQAYLDVLGDDGKPFGGEYQDRRRLFHEGRRFCRRSVPGQIYRFEA